MAQLIRTAMRMLQRSLSWQGRFDHPLRRKARLLRKRLFLEPLEDRRLLAADISVTKIASPEPAVPGGPLSYTITVQNLGDAQGTTTLTDVFPIGFNGVAVTSNATNATGNTPAGTGNISDTLVIDPTGSVTYTVTGTLSDTATGPITNTATASAAAGETITGNNTATATTNLPTDLAVTKTDGQTTVAAGSNVTYTIVVSNVGSNAVTGATLTDLLPANATFVSLATPAGWTPTTPAVGQTGTVTATNTAALPVGGTATFTLIAAVNANAAGAVTNTATIQPANGTTDVNSTNNAAVDTDTVSPVVASADLRVTKTDGVTTVAPGSTVTYDIVIGNAGPSAVTGATVADIVPANLMNATFTASGSGGANGFSSGAGNINQTVNLPVGSTITYTLTGTVPSDAAGALSNTAAVTAPAGVADTSPGNNVANDTDLIALNTALSDLSITKTDGVTTVAPGGTATYTIVVSNLGTVPVTGATLTDILPANTTLGNFTPPTGWTANTATPGVLTATNSTPLPAGGSVTFTIPITVNQTAAGAITNTATITAPAGVADLNAANNLATDTDTVGVTPVTADLTITKNDNLTAVTPGQTVQYTITVSNAGQTAVNGATVADVFPPTLTNVTFTAANNGGAGGGTPGSGNINQTVNLPAGGSVVYTVNATVSPTAIGAIANTATVTTPAGVTDTNPTNNTATDIDTVTVTIVQTDLSVTKTDNATSIAAGGPITYTIVVTNNGTTGVTGATLTDVVPANTTFTSFTAPAGWTVAAPAPGGTGTVTATNTTALAAGASATFTLVVAASQNAAGTVSNTATITPPTGTVDVNPFNNTATDIDTVTGTTASADLAIFKTDGVLTVTPGQTVTYTIVVSNAGPNAVPSAVVNDVFPNTLTNVNYTVATTGGATGATNGSGTITQTVDMPVGSTITYIVTATVIPTATAGTTIDNTATVTAPEGIDTNSANNSSTDTDTVVATTTGTTDLSVFKSDGATTAVAGQNLTYTILVANLGTTPVTGATLTDVLPANTTFVSLTPPAGWNVTGPTAGVVTATNTTALASGGTAAFTLVVTVNSGATGAVTNTATVTPPTGTADVNPVNNVSSDTDTIIAVAPESQVDLSITKTDNSTSATPGGTITYTIVVSNSAGSATATNAVVTDTFPPSITGVTYSASGSTNTGGFSSGSGNINQTVTIPAGGSITYVVTGTVNPNAAGAIENTATVTPPADVTDTNLTNNAATDIDTVTTVDIGVTKSDTPDPVSAGQNITYTITLTNTGTGPAAPGTVTLTDIVPANTTFVSFVGPAGWTVSGVAGGGTGTVTATNTTATIAGNGGTAVFTFIVAVNGATPGNTVITNTATSTDVADINGQNNSASTTTTVATIDVGVTKSDTPDPVLAGQNITYTITLNNTGTGTSAANSVTLTDAVPANTTFVSCTAPTGWACTNNSGTVTATNTTGTLAPNTPTVFSLVVAVNAATAAGTTITNTATVAATGDTTGGNNSATTTTTVATIDVGITKTDTPDPITAGQNITYTITLTNSGTATAAANSVTLTDAVPTNTSFVSCTAPTGWTCTNNTGTVTATNTTGTLAPNTPVVFTLVVGVNAATPAGTTITNTATVSATGDTTGGNNTATTTTTVQAATPTIDVGVTKVDTPDPVTAGQNITYTITLTNGGTGTAAANSVTLTDALPANTTFVSFTPPTGWTFTNTNGSITAKNTTGTLAPNGTATFTYVVMANTNSPLGTTITNTANVTATGDINNANNSATATTTVNAIAEVTVTKTENADTVAAGDTLTYTIIVSNTGGAAATNVTLNDVIPTNTTFVSATQTGSGTPFILTTPAAGGTGTVAATAATLPAGGTATFQMVVQVDSTATGGTDISNTAVVTATNDTNQNNNSSTVTATVEEVNAGLPVCEDLVNISTANESGDLGTAVITDDADNPGVPGANVLLITGTNKNDVIVVEPQPKSRGMMRVVQNKHVIVTFISSDVKRIVIFGLGGNDSITINPIMIQPSTVFGGSGNDTIVTSNGDSLVDGGDGNDTIVTGRGNDQVSGGNGNDVIVGGSGNDALCGDGGNDVIHGGLGDDTLFGETGNDKLFGDAGNDLLLGGDGNDFLFGSIGNDELYGQAGNDQLYGDPGNDIVVGGDGNDKLFGSTGRDILIGGQGSDTLYGEAGDDILIGGSTANDENREALEAILAEWNSSNSYNDRVDNIRLGGGGANGGFTFDEASVFDDNAADTLYGDGGNDWFIVGPRDRIKDRARNERVN